MDRSSRRLETAALAFAAAIAADDGDASMPVSLTVNAARVALLIELAEQAAQTLCLDETLCLLRAAEEANTHVDGPIDRRIGERVVDVARSVVAQYERASLQADFAQVRAVDFTALIEQVTCKWLRVVDKECAS